MSSPADSRPGDAPGWVRLSAETKAYERARASVACAGRVVRPQDRVALERELAALRPS